MGFLCINIPYLRCIGLSGFLLHYYRYSSAAILTAVIILTMIISRHINMTISSRMSSS